MSLYLFNRLSTKPSKVLAVVLLIGVATSSQATTYLIVPDNSNVRFEIDHFKTSTNSGGFYNVTGQLKYDPTTKTGDISIVIPMNSLNTGNVAFNNVLKSPDFFDVAKFPLAEFKSIKWHFSTDKGDTKVTQVDGNLTMHGKTNPVTLTATKFNCYFSFIAKKQVCGGDFTTTIDRRKWNISKYTLLGITENVVLKVQIEAAKQ